MIRAPAERPGSRYVKLTHVLTKSLYRMGLRSWHFQVTSLGAIGLCIGLWIRAKTLPEDERGNAERRALFVGLWPPTFWLIADSIERLELDRSRPRWKLR